MEHVTILLADPQKEYAEKQVAEGRYTSMSAYFDDLVRADERRQAEDEMEAYLLEGLNAPLILPVDKNFWDDIKTRGKARAEARRKAANDNR